MRAAWPATSAEAKEVPKFASSRMASTGPVLSLSRLLQTAIEMVFTALKNPVTSAATPTTSGAVRFDPAVAGPLDVKFRMFSSRFELNCVCTSWKCPPTEIKSFAVAGGETCSGWGMFGSLSSIEPSNRSGYWLCCWPLKFENHFCTWFVPSCPTGANTM